MGSQVSAGYSIKVSFSFLSARFLFVYVSDVRLRSRRNLDGLFNAIRRRRVDLLAGLGNLRQDCLVGEARDDLGGLVLEGDFVAVDACTRMLVSEPVEVDLGASGKLGVAGRGRGVEDWIMESEGWGRYGIGAHEPSSFLSTLSMAPEQPPQLMVTLNSYVWDSDMVAAMSGTVLGACLKLLERVCVSKKCLCESRSWSVWECVRVLQIFVSWQRSC